MSASYTIKHVIDRLALWAGSHSSYFLDILNGNIQLTVRKLAPNETTNTHVNHTMEVSLSCYFPCKHLTKEENKRKPKPWPHNNNKLRKYTPTKGQRLFPNCMECYLEVIRQPQWIPYSGKFLNGASFRIFRMLAPYSKIKTAKIWTARAAAWSAVQGANNVSVQLLCRGFETECPSQSQWITIGIS